MPGPSVLFDPRGEAAEFPRVAAAYASPSDEDPNDPRGVARLLHGIGDAHQICASVIDDDCFIIDT